MVCRTISCFQRTPYSARWRTTENSTASSRISAATAIATAKNSDWTARARKFRDGNKTGQSAPRDRRRAELVEELKRFVPVR